MNKNTTRIKDGIRALAGMPHEIISGTVIAGSINDSSFTMSVQPNDDSAPIKHVMLTTATENDNGVILFPKEGSNVVIGSVDGSGEWVLLRCGEITKIKAKIIDVEYEIDDAQVKIQNGGSLFNIGSTVFKMNTSGESLFQLLKDLITELTALTVTTSTGISSTPNNTTNFSALLVRLNNLLSA
ncbi:MAG: hypothetical protein JWQ38_189 [Flavipsychrobacter sp.]|nr:hypothetical protein [Flavipsychrobacter sp.]